MTKSISSKIFIILFALTFLGVGIFTFTKTEHVASASTATEESVTNSTPEYFSATDSGSSGLIDSNIFMYSATSQNSLTLSLDMNGTGSAQTGIYAYVYYPSLSNTSTFQFVSGTGTVSLSINGKDQSSLLVGKTFFESTGYYFENLSDSILETFSMQFTYNGSGNSVKILDSDNNLIEGLYEVTLDYLLITCTDGTDDGTEETFSSERIAFTYSFYVVSESEYFDNGKPVISNGEFDNVVTITDDKNDPDSAYYLYSNYSSKNGIGSATGSNKVPYIEYDPTRYDVSISKNLNSALTTYSISYDTDGTIVASDDLLYTYSNGKLRLYFVDLGAYTITFTATYVTTISGEVKKLPLDGITESSKNVMVYLYGYQASYTDFDKDRDENNARQLTELKTVDTSTYSFTDSADITSSFLASDDDYSQANQSQTFLNAYIFNYINSSGIKPVTTNQKPVRFTSNVNLYSENSSYVFTNQSLSGYEASSFTLNSTTLYMKNFTGTTESTPGTYVYIIAYKYDDYYASEGSLAAGQIFYQIFYFEITNSNPEITVKTGTSSSGETVLSNKYYNTTIYVNDDTKENDPYCMDVTVQIYAYDYASNAYITQFGGSSGIALSSILGTSSSGYYDMGATSYSIVLEANAYYTIRLFYTSNLNSGETTTAIGNTSGFISSMSFYIDMNEISGLAARNATQSSNSSTFQILTSFDAVTNQSFVLSWNTKASGASISAYYRYFPLVDTSFYSLTDTSNTSTLISSMLSLSNNRQLIAVDSVLDLSGTGATNWLPLAASTTTGGNTKAYADFSYVSTDFVLSDAGLYVIELVDEAGNIAFGVYMIDDTTPNFVIQDTTSSSGYSIASSVQYIKNTSNLFWGNYKAIYIKGLSYGLLTTATTVTSEDLSDEVYADQSGSCNIEIFNILKSFYTQNLLQYVENNTTVLSEISESKYITSYSSMYLTIAVEDLTYYTTTGTYTSQNSKTSESFDIDSYSDGLTYSILIRDASNTQQDFTNTSTLRQYEYYYSAKQTIVISFDTSELQLTYQDSSDTTTTLVSYTSSSGTDDNSRATKTSYFHPTSLDKAFSLSFLPTVEDDDSIIQVDNLTIYYYAYETASYELNGLTYYYTTLSTEPETLEIYSYNGNNAQTSAYTTEINVGTDGYTKAGKYVITRTYYLSTDQTSKYTYSNKDVFTLSLVLYVDRYDVISSPETVASGKTESLVGGDVIISMFDSGSDSSIVVTFPNSDAGSENSDGQTLFNSATSSSSVKTALTTNKLPVNVYIPVFKYTKYVTQVADTSGYHFEVVSDPAMNSFYSTTTGDGTAAVTTYEYIKEYVLYAEIYNGDTTNPNNLIASTSTDLNTAISDYSSNNGFLVFYDKSGSVLSSLTDAGEYYVVLQQGYFGEEHSSDNAYDQSIIFKFVIENATPDFVATTTNGENLNSESASGSISEIYYTNQSDILLTWDASTDDYSVQIDLKAITVFAVTAGKISTTYSTAKNAENALVWKVDPKLSTSGSYYSATLSLETLGVYEDGGYVEISMQFENHSSYYSTVCKRICVDLVAPYTNINSLLEKTLGSGLSIGTLSESTLRTYQTAKGQTTTSYLTASYNLSNSDTDGYFAYYSYQVDESFLSSLKSAAASEALTDTSGNLQYLTYIRAVTGKYTSSSTASQEATQSTFSANNYSLIGGNTSAYVTALNMGTYYEIVECDKAGNMTVYTIYVVDKTSTDTILLSATSSTTDEAGNIETDTREYTSEEYLQAEADNTTKTLFLRTGYTLDSINYFGDEWAIVRLTTYGENNSTTTQALVLSPTQKDYAYQVDGTTMTLVTLSSLIDSTFSTESKHILEIYDRANGVWDTLYISVYNTSLAATFSQDSSEENITFTQPLESYLTSNSATTAVYLKQLAIKVTIPGSVEPTVIYGADNNGEIVYVTNLTGLASNWKGTDDQVVTVTTTANSITFSLDLSAYGAGTKVKYYFVDNFGKTYIETHIFGETVISQPVTTSDETLYSYLNSDGETVYISQTSMSYTFNTTKNTVVVVNKATGERSDDATFSNSYVVSGATAVLTSESSGGTTTITLTATAEYDATGFKTSSYDLSFAFLVFDQESYTDSTSENYDKEVLFRLYDELPVPTTSSVSAGQFRIIDSNTNDITAEILGLAESSNGGYYSEVRVIYSLDSTLDIPVVYSISTDGVHWEELASNTRLRNTSSEMITYYLKIWYQDDALQNTYGSTWSYVFQNVPDEQIFTFNLSSLTSTYWVEKTVDGETEVVSKSGSTFEYNGNKYSNHYTVNLSYSMSAANEDAPVRIRVNQEYGLTVTSLDTFETNGITSEILLVESTESLQYNLTFTVVISFIPPTDEIVDSFYISGLNGTLEDDNFTKATSYSVTVTEEYTTLNTIRLQWTKYYGIKENPVSIYITKEDGSVLDPTLYTTSDSNGDYYYTYLTYSGKYSIMFKDTAGNVQKFSSGSRGQSEIFTLTFLKDVPFNLTYTDLDGNEITTLPTTQSMFNSAVTLTIPSTLISQFYGYPSISVTLNGAEYAGDFSTSATTFTFTSAGSYEVTLSATLATGEILRSESFQFTIVSADEHKISYVLNKYSNYYVESVTKDGTDITDTLLATLDTDTIVVDGVERLASLPISYLDEKTGSGVYVITVNANSSLYGGTDSDVLTSWTYQITINQGTTPIKISLDEGASTTSEITITYNAENMYVELGNCIIRVMSLSDSGTLSLASSEYEITSESTGENTITITGTGTFFIQVVSASGNLLFSYKVIKNEAMNAATIIIIVIAVLLTLVVAILIFRLRKRISVK